MDLTKFSAYGGGSWNARPKSIKEECEDYIFWNDLFGLNSEYKSIRCVVLNSPCEDAIQKDNEDPERFQMLDKVDFEILSEELRKYRGLLKSLGIEVIDGYSKLSVNNPNIVFARDLFAMTPKGAILGRPATMVRAGEEVEMMRTFGSNSLPILATVVEGSFEGADMLWLDEEHVAVDRSSRTSMEAADFIHEILNTIGVTCMHTHLDTPGNQHLLGCCNIINKKVACIRTEKIPKDLVEFMRSWGYKFIEFDETKEVAYKQAMNLVTVAPGEVCMPFDCPETHDKLMLSGYVSKIHKVKITELRKMAGGLACLTGIIGRDMSPDPTYQGDF
jgi:N-dimethylarginine dimethylaminohydrolase